jgi:hypothetical protein
MIRHYDEFMQKIGGAPVVIEGIDEKPCPALIAK